LVQIDFLQYGLSMENTISNDCLAKVVAYATKIITTDFSDKLVLYHLNFKMSVKIIE